MSKSEGEGKKLPEWSIFDRLDELENITLQLMDTTDKTMPTSSEIEVSSKDAILMAGYGIWSMFLVACKLGADSKVGKKLIIEQLVNWGVSEKPLQWMERMLNAASDFIEEE